jgi:formate hydrogenlyase subunit 6/NADH:ubiquinone oxidoreductase subunit I
MVQYFNDIYKAVSSALVGMSITIKHIYRKPVTLQFPDERQVMSDRFRGFVHNDMAKCDSCNICAKLCPVDCIYIETEGKGKERMMTRYAIDYNKCIWCSMCTENCHTGSITMSHDYDHSVYDRKTLVYEFMDPREGTIPCHRQTRIDTGWWVEEKAEKPKPKPKPKPSEDSPPAEAAPVAETPTTPAEPAAPTEPAADQPSDDKGEDK